jgi:hypothetical protein
MAFLDLKGRYRRADDLAGVSFHDLRYERGFEDDFCQHWPDIRSILSEIFVRGCIGSLISRGEWI